MRGIALIIAVLTVTGCAVIDPDRIDGVRQLAAWRDQAVSQAPGANESCKAKYNSAKSRVDGVIDIAWKSSIDNTAAQWWGTVDLSTNAIPSDTVTAIRDYLECPSAPSPLAGAEVIVPVVVKSIDDLLGAKRKASADGLKATLEKVKWPTWESARNPGNQ